MDADGSFWDEVGGVNANDQAIDLAADGEMINATPGLLIVLGDQAFFKTDSGTVVTFARHDADKEFPGCM